MISKYHIWIRML